MKPKEAFGVVVRSFGLFGILWGIYSGCFTALHLLGFGRSSAPTEFVFSGSLFLVGLATFLSAELIVRFAYGRDHDSN
jgi:hypothetical protein